MTIHYHSQAPKRRSRQSIVFILASGGLDLGSGALCTLLADDASTSLALAGSTSVLGLVGLLGSSFGLLLLLALLNGCETGGGASLGAHGALLLDHIERGTNDGTLGLDSAAGPLLGGFLYGKACQLTLVLFLW